MPVTAVNRVASFLTPAAQRKLGQVVAVPSSHRPGARSNMLDTTRIRYERDRRREFERVIFSTLNLNYFIASGHRELAEQIPGITVQAIRQGQVPMFEIRSRMADGYILKGMTLIDPQIVSILMLTETLQSGEEVEYNFILGPDPEKPSGFTLSMVSRKPYPFSDVRDIVRAWTPPRLPLQLADNLNLDQSKHPLHNRVRADRASTQRHVQMRRVFRAPVFGHNAVSRMLNDRQAVNATMLASHATALARNDTSNMNDAE